MIDILAGILLIIGSFFALTASIGIIRLPDVYSRMHAASKAGTVGSGILMVVLALTTDDSSTAIRALAGILFFIMTAPIAAHLLARAAYKVGYKLWSGSVVDEMNKPVTNDSADAK